MPLSIAFSDVEFELVACSCHLHRVVVVDIGSVGVVSGDNCYDRGGIVSAAFDVNGGCGGGCGVNVLGDWLSSVRMKISNFVCKTKSRQNFFS